MEIDASHSTSIRGNFWRRGLAAAPRLIVAAIGGVVLALLALSAPPRDFPTKQDVKISEGLSISSAAHELRRQNVIRSPSLLTLIILIRGKESIVHAGTYRFDRPLSAFSIARKVTSSDFNIPFWRVTIPEGLSVKDMAGVFESALTSFDSEGFLKLAAEHEGYLFPDTYSISDAVTLDELISLMKQNFDNRIAPYQAEIASSGHTLKEIITIASLLEEEARQTETRRTISGILWKRLELGMLLQVDATLRYLLGKSSHELTLSDLEYDSPFNTYKYPGLPPGPISNPGLDAILAALHPLETPYLFFLTDDDGGIYYARTFEEHKENRAKYLR